MVAAAGAAEAGRPFSTDDASILDPGHCQVEAWVDRSRAVTLASMAPACNFGLGIEWELGGGRATESGSARFVEAYAQAKILLADPTQRPIGVGLTAGILRRPHAGEKNGWDNPYLTIPFTHIASSTTQIHASIGALQDREGRRTLTLWGVAIDHSIAPRWAVLAETFGENGSRPFFRAGVRWIFRPGIELDLSAVSRIRAERGDRFLTAGVTIAP